MSTFFLHFLQQSKKCDIEQATILPFAQYRILLIIL